MRTPWGNSHSITIVANGILSVSTAGHGGVRLYLRRNRQVPDYLRATTHRQLGTSGWYEEDCDWCIPAIVFEPEWRAWADGSNWTSGPEQLDCAWSSFRNWHPDAYERYTGKRLGAGESYLRDEVLFREAHRDDYVGLAAWGDWHALVPSGMVGVFAGRGGRRPDGRYPPDTRYFLVPEEDYDRDRWSRLGQASHFVMDLDRHAECPPIK